MTPLQRLRLRMIIEHVMAFLGALYSLGITFVGFVLSGMVTSVLSGALFFHALMLEADLIEMQL